MKKTVSEPIMVLL